MNFIIKLLYLLISVKSFSFAYTPPPPVPAPVPQISLLPGGRPPQFVVLSFDGSQSLDMWQKTLEFSRAQKQQGISVPFTYFISSVYFITPDQSFGESKIGFGTNENEISSRVQLIKQAVADGHEIGSHLNGHTDSTGWSAADWDREFSNFSKYTGVLNNQFVGFRSPNLNTNSSLWPVMVKYKYLYEAGQVGNENQWPQKIDGVWRIYLPNIHLVNTDKYPLAMDYNFYVAQTDAKNLYKYNTAEWRTARQQILDSFLAYFQHNYSGNRAPVVFSAHFADWNGGLYWSALQQFASQVCNYPETKCVTYKELVNFLESNPQIASLRSQ